MQLLALRCWCLYATEGNGNNGTLGILWHIFFFPFILSVRFLSYLNSAGICQDDCEEASSIEIVITFGFLILFTQHSGIWLFWLSHFHLILYFSPLIWGHTSLCCLSHTLSLISLNLCPASFLIIYKCLHSMFWGLQVASDFSRWSSCWQEADCGEDHKLTV